MKRTLAVLTGLLLFLAWAAVSARAAASPPWTVLRPGKYLSVAVTPSATPGSPSVIFAGQFDDGAGSVIRSEDGGASWAPIFPHYAFSLAADPSNPGRIYAATESGLFRTTDYGATWSLLNSNVHVWVSVSPVSPQVLFGDTARSFDGGLTWTPGGLPVPSLTNPSELFHVKSSASNPPNVYRMLNNIIYQSTDGGLTWTEVPASLGKADTVEVDPVDGRYWYTGSCGGGATRFFPGGSASIEVAVASHGHAMVVDPRYHNRVYAVSEGDGIRVSYDFGATWQMFGPATIGIGMIPEGRMVMDASDGKLYLPTKGQGLWVASTEACTDADHDGYYLEGTCGPQVDCNDSDPDVHPNAAEVCGDSLDNDCSGKADCEDAFCTPTFHCPQCVDQDVDGFYGAAGCGTPVDCNDNDGAIRPGAVDLPGDGIDQNCDGYQNTIQVTKATFSTTKSTLTVEATTSYGDATYVLQCNYGPMRWVAPTRRTPGKYTFTLSNVGNPGVVTVTGIEGSASAPVQVTQK